MVLPLGEDRKLAGRRRKSVRAVEDHGGADLMPSPEDGQKLRLEVDPDPHWAGSDAPVVPAKFAIFHGIADIEDRPDRAVDQPGAIGFANLGGTEHDAARWWDGGRRCSFGAAGRHVLRKCESRDTYGEGDRRRYNCRRAHGFSARRASLRMCGAAAK